MGVRGLWPTISDIGERRSLCSYLTDLKIQLNNANAVLRVGVDMSTLMGECVGATFTAGIHGQTAGGALKNLFLKLSAFSKCPATFIFVLEGKGRPAIKRGHAVKHKPLFWEPAARALIGHYGFHTHDAPGEAEAELAKLSDLGMIDGIITSDGDVFVYGGRVVFRTLPKVERTEFDDEIGLFKREDLQAMDLSPGGLILFALLCGGDYDSGIEGCGPVTAYALAQCGFGDRLLNAVKTMRGQELKAFMTLWRADLRHELMTNTHKTMKKVQPSIASLINEAFPKEDILDLYVNPLTSWSTPLSSNTPDASNWIAKEPSIHDLAKFCSDNLHWNTEEVLKKEFMKHVWTGVLLQMLYSPMAMYDRPTSVLRTPKHKVCILDKKYMVRQGRLGSQSGLETPIEQPRITVLASDFVQLMGESFDTDSKDKVRVWVPEALLPNGLEMSGEKIRSRKKGKSNKITKSSKKGESSKKAKSSKKAAKFGKKVKPKKVQSVSHQSQASENVASTSTLPPAPRWLGFIDLTVESKSDSGIIDLTMDSDADI